MTTNLASAWAYFGSMVESYDSLMRRCVPRYEEMSTRLIEYRPASASAILELGCGTGNLSLRLAVRFPDAQFTFVDAAPEMIDVTRARLQREHPQLAERATFMTARFEDLDLAPHSFDLVTSCISLHHVRDKAALYRAIFQALVPDSGTFRFADQLSGGTEANHQLNWSRWLEFCSRPGHCTADEIQSLLDHAEAHDHYTPLAEHFRLLEAAGFAQLDCVWRNWIWGIITAERGGRR
jgi:ubiquinone/menaquinone biosynthesis C-methylase UbiE